MPDQMKPKPKRKRRIEKTFTWFVVAGGGGLYIFVLKFVGLVSFWCSNSMVKRGLGICVLVCYTRLEFSQYLLVAAATIRATQVVRNTVLARTANRLFSHFLDIRSLFFLFSRFMLVFLAFLVPQELET